MIVTFTGPSGSGKTILAKGILNKLAESEIIISYTSRKFRDSDLLLNEYFYVSDDYLIRMKDESNFLWIVGEHGNLYGTKKEDINKAMIYSNKLFLMQITPDLVLYLRDYARGKNISVLSFFIFVDNEKILAERLAKRGESQGEIKKRIKDCKSWYKYAKKSARGGNPLYIFIDNSGLPEEAENKIMFWINTAKKVFPQQLSG